MSLDVGVLSGRIKIDTSDVQCAADRLERLNRSTQRAGQEFSGASQQMTRSSQERVKATNQVAQSTRKASQATEKYSVDTTDLVKSTQVALGPLSGVASRIAALTAIFNRNNVALATFLGAFTAFIVAMQRSISVGSELERQLRGTEAIIEAVGASSGITAEQINEMAQALGRDTLTSAQQARGAFNMLLTFGIESRDVLQEAATAAQGLSAVMGGGLQQNTRRIGRLLERPTENLNSLRRAGIQFSNEQQDVIQRLERTGNLAEAQSRILDRLSAFTSAAEDEAQGLAGAMDTLGENFAQAFENASLFSGAVGSLTGTVNRLADAVQALSENDRIIENLGRAFQTVADAGGRALAALFENIDLVISAATFLFVNLLAGRVVAILPRVVAGISAMTAALASFRAGVATTITAASALNVALRAIPFVAAISAGTAVFASLRTEVDDTNNSLNRTQRLLDQANRRAQQFGGASSELRDLRQQFELFEAMVDSNDARLEELNQQLEGLRGGPGAAAEERQEFMRLRDSIRGVEGENRRLEESLERMQDRIRENIDAMIESEEVARDFGGSVNFIEDMRSSFMSTQVEVEEFSEQLEDIQTIVGNLANASEAELARFENAVGLSRDEMEELLSQMERENVVNEFAREIRDLQDDLGALQFGAEQFVLGDDQAFDRAQMQMEAIREIEDLTESQREAAAGALDAQSASVGDLVDAYVDLQMSIERAGQAQRQLEDIEDFMAEFDRDVAADQIRREFDERRRVLEEAFGGERDEYAAHFDALDRMEEERINNIRTRKDQLIEEATGDFNQIANALTNMVDTELTGIDGMFAQVSFGMQAMEGTLAQMDSVMDERFTAYQRFAQAQALVNAALAVSQVWADERLDTWQKFGLSGVVGGLAGAQVAAIQAQHFADGGQVSGPGTSRSDSVPAMLSDGEFVMSASAVRRIGTNNLMAMNQGRTPMMAQGGQVGSSAVGSSPTFNVIDQRRGGSPIEMEETTGADGQPQINAIVKDSNRENLRRGRHDTDMNARFGLRRQPARR